MGEPDTDVTLRQLMTDKPTTREQHLERSLKRGATRRKIEDHILEKVSDDLW